METETVSIVQENVYILNKKKERSPEATLLQGGGGKV
jgi:hypothetical protein